MKQGLKTLIAGVVIFVVGAFIVPIAFIVPLLLDSSDQRQFIIPGSAEIEVKEPGRYYLWNDFQTVYDGRSYNRSESIPDGLEIKIADESGQEFKFATDSSFSSTSGSSSKKSIGYVEVTSPGWIAISVTGNSEERVFSFSRSGMMKILGLIVGGFVLSMLVGLAGIGVVLLGIVKLVKSSRKGEPADASSPSPRVTPAADAPVAPRSDGR